MSTLGMIPEDDLSYYLNREKHSNPFFFNMEKPSNTSKFFFVLLNVKQQLSFKLAKTYTAL